jgi:hypothetical protein
VLVLGHMGRTPEQALAHVFRDSSVLVPVLTLVASHAVRIGRTARRPDESAEALPPKLQMALLVYRMFLMMFLASFASPGLLSRVMVPAYVTIVAVLLTFSDLYPRRFLARLGVSGLVRSDGEKGAVEDVGTQRPGRRG